MVRKFNFAKLFESKWRFNRELVIYPTRKAHLDGMRSGKKQGLSLFGFSISSMTERGSEYLELLELAFERDLVVVLQNKPIVGLPFERQIPQLFVARPEELWRIPAWIALWETAFTDGQWTNAAEAQCSLLLGYTKKQRATWLADMRQHRARGAVYALLTPEQKRRVVSLGQRCFGDNKDLESITLLFSRKGTRLRPNALRLLPSNVTLARVALGEEMFRKLFGDQSTWKRGSSIEARIPKRLAAEVNRTLTSNVQLLTARGWR